MFETIANAIWAYVLCGDGNFVWAGKKWQVKLNKKCTKVRVYDEEGNRRAVIYTDGRTMAQLTQAIVCVMD